MGTRSDFYVGRGEHAEWLGSRGWDGYPEGVPFTLREAPTEAAYRAEVAEHLARHDDSTLPEQGWPWPWETSSTTDFAYAFEDGKVYGSCFGREWFDAAAPPVDEEEDGGKVAAFPDMSDRKNVTFGARSGLIVIAGSG